MLGFGHAARCVRRVFVLMLAVICGTNTHAAEVDVKNDSLIEPNRIVNFNEVLWLILAFTGEPYPFRAPADCP